MIGNTTTLIFIVGVVAHWRQDKAGSCQHRIRQGMCAHWQGRGPLRVPHSLVDTTRWEHYIGVWQGALSKDAVTGRQTAATGLRLFEDIGPAGVKAINTVPEASVINMVVIQIDPYYAGHARDVGRQWMCGRWDLRPRSWWWWMKT